jgi:hypothetical protein
VTEIKWGEEEKIIRKAEGRRKEEKRTKNKDKLPKQLIQH